VGGGGGGAKGKKKESVLSEISGKLNIPFNIRVSTPMVHL